MRDTDSEALAHRRAQELEARQTEAHDVLVRSGRALDLKAAHARCFSGGNHGVARVTGR